VIVGGVAWNGADTARALAEDQRLRGLVVLLEDVDDTALTWLYDRALLTVYPSLYEGWGLPVAESLARGRICIASRRSSVPEIAPGADRPDRPAGLPRLACPAARLRDGRGGPHSA
jgi:glycosyltransferase involved in cell wall biosynthesis